MLNVYLVCFFLEVSLCQFKSSKVKQIKKSQIKPGYTGHLEQHWKSTWWRRLPHQHLFNFTIWEKLDLVGSLLVSNLQFIVISLLFLTSLNEREFRTSSIKNSLSKRLLLQTKPESYTHPHNHHHHCRFQESSKRK